MKTKRLSAGFFGHPTKWVARNLIGCVLVHGKTRGMIVETEAYTGENDPGSHAYRGRKTRNAPMYGPPGRAYVYKCHVWPLLNVVTERQGTPGAVLIRAVIPLDGIKEMSRRRGTDKLTDLARGPGRLAQAFGITLAHNRADLVHGALRIEQPVRKVKCRLRRTTRIGLHGPAAKIPWRWHAANCRFVS